MHGYKLSSLHEINTALYYYMVDLSNVITAVVLFVCNNVIGKRLETKKIRLSL
jgi:hypothetical protein